MLTRKDDGEERSERILKGKI